MFFLGVRVDHASATAFFVIIEKCLKNVRHYYAVKEARRFPAASCRDEVIAFYRDKNYTIRKRIYSQDRRPKKDVSARPTIVLAAGQDDQPLLDGLRRADVPVEAVFLGNAPENVSSSAPDRAGIGRNHLASESMIYETMIRVMAQQRLAPLAEALTRKNELSASLARMLDDLRRESPGRPPNDRLSPVQTATAAPIWFRENVRYTTAYRTSATSIRQFK